MRMLCLATALLSIAFAPAKAWAETDFSGEIDLLEMHLGKGEDHFVFDSTFEMGAAILKLEGGSDVGPHVDEVTSQLLYARPVGETTRFMVGLRHDFRGGADLSHGVVAIELELLPWLEAEHFLFLSEHGNLTGAGQLTATARLDEGLALEPRLAVGWSAQQIPSEEVGSGIGEMELSARLRKQLNPVLNAYVGAIHERLIGKTRDFATDLGEKGGVSRVIVGIGLNF